MQTKTQHSKTRSTTQMVIYLLKNQSKKANFLLSLSLFSIFFFAVTGNALNFHIFSIVNIKISEILLLINLFLLVLENIRKPFFHTHDIGIALFLFIWCIYSALVILPASILSNYSIQEAIRGLLYNLRFTIFLFYTSIFAKYISKHFAYRRVENCIILAFTIVCFVGFLQLIFFPVAYDFYALFWKIGVYWPNADPHIGRLLSTYLDPNYLSSCLLIPVYLLIKRIVSERKSRTVNILLLVITVIAILLTKSRSGFLGLAIIAVMHLISWLFSKKVPFYAKMLIVAIFIAFPIFMLTSNIGVIVRLRSGVSDGSSTARFDSWKMGLQIFKNNPIFGIGYNMTGAYKSKFSLPIADSTVNGMDSSLIMILSCSGILGFSLYLIYFFKLFSNRKISLTYKSLMAAGLVICNFNQLLFYQFWLVLTSILLYDEISTKKYSVLSKHPSLLGSLIIDRFSRKDAKAIVLLRTER